MTPKERTAMQQALKCAERCESIDGMYSWADTITALREALAEQVEQSSYAATPTTLAEPVATVKRNEDDSLTFTPLRDFYVVNGMELYAEPANKTEEKPLLVQAWEKRFAEQAQQEPVAWMDLHKELGKLRWMGGDEGWDNAINAVRDRLIELSTPQPVRTKDHCNPLQDLTDDEIEKAVVYKTSGWLTNARAVITADREKNK